MSRVLVVATSRKTRGGITSVVKAHETGEQWKKYHCRWIETHRDKSTFVKLKYLLFSLFQYVFLLPQYDIIHIHLSEPPSALRKLPFMWLAKIGGKKTIVHFHSFSVETTIDSKWKWLYKYLFRNADIVITLSEYWRKQVTVFLDDKTGKVKRVYNPCPQIDDLKQDNIYMDLCPEGVKQHVILYAGTLTPRKGYADLIKAFAKIADKYQSWKIVFAGNGEIEQGIALAEKMGISAQTHFLGWCSGVEKDRAFREADIFCLPSYAEGFPMAVLDAWAYGLPVITTPVGGIPDIAKDGENMLLFNPGDINALTNCIDRMINDTSLRSKISYASKEFAANEFNIDTINGLIGKIYKQLK